MRVSRSILQLQTRTPESSEFLINLWGYFEWEEGRQTNDLQDTFSRILHTINM